MSILALLERGKRLSRDGVAIVARERIVNYPQFIEAVREIAAGLATRGIGRGNRVAVMSPNSPESLMAAYGVMASGATYVPIPAKGSWQDSLHLIRGFDCNGLLYHFELDATVEKLRSGLASLDFLIEIASDSSPDGAFAELGSVAGEVPRPSAVDATAWLGATGGTTGAPKGVEVSWRAIYAFVQKFLVELPQTDPVMLAATPLTHGAGMLAIPIFASGGRVVVTEGLVPDEYLSLIERHRVTMTFLPPTAIYRLLDHPGVDKRNYSSLRHFFYGAAAMSVSRLKQSAAGIRPYHDPGLWPDRMPYHDHFNATRRSFY
jgi:acyl-CoA synthetase (AMP-forming)/AMP-acid ligase II